MMTDTLLYCAYGADTYVAEATFSLLTAFAWIPPGGAINYVVYTDRPDAFADLKVVVVPITPALREEWEGEDRYALRVKMCVQRDAVHRFSGRVVFVDTDTSFLKSPRRLFDRIGPGRSVLHVGEARLGEIDASDFNALREMIADYPPIDLNDAPIAIPHNEMMWNSGVAGLDSRDGWLLDEAIALVDQLRRRPQARMVRQLDQFATGVILTRHTTISEAVDVVFHYWFHDVKAGFHARLPGLLAAGRGSDLRGRARAARAAAPSTSPIRRFKMRVRTIARRLGVAVPGLRASP